MEEQVAAGRQTGLLYIDLDGFKPVNDRHGHAAGDAVLRIVADRLRSTARPGDFIARVGGDEFAVCVVGPVDEGAAAAHAAELARVVAEPIRGGAVGVDGEVAVTASIGVAVSSEGADPDALLAAADTAMYDAKRGGRERRDGGFDGRGQAGVAPRT